MAIVLLVATPKLFPKLTRVAPPALLATLAVSGLAVFFAGVERIILPANIGDAIHWQASTLLSLVQKPEIMVYGLEIGLVASMESMLCAAAVARMKNFDKLDYNRELSAQGVGNFLCGLVGALPVTSVIVRSAANVQAGATSNWSSILHGFWALLMLAFGVAIAEQIPLTALAAILLVTGFKLINFKYYHFGWTRSLKEFSLASVTCIIVVAQGLLVGVLMGISLQIIIWGINSRFAKPTPITGTTAKQPQ